MDIGKAFCQIPYIGRSESQHYCEGNQRKPGIDISGRLDKYRKQMPVHLSPGLFHDPLLQEGTGPAVDVCEIAPELGRESEIKEPDYGADREHQVIHAHLLLRQHIENQRKSHEARPYQEELRDVAPDDILTCYIDSHIISSPDIFPCPRRKPCRFQGS